MKLSSQLSTPVSLESDQTTRFLKDLGIDKKEGMTIVIPKDLGVDDYGYIVPDRTYPYIFRGTTLVTQPNSQMKEHWMLIKGGSSWKLMERQLYAAPQCPGCLYREVSTRPREWEGIELDQYCDDCFRVVDGKLLIGGLTSFDQDRLQEED